MRDRLNEISASDRFPLGVTSSDVVPLVEYLRLSEMKRDTRGPGLSSADEARLQFLGKNYKALIERLDIPFDPQNQSNYR